MVDNVKPDRPDAVESPTRTDSNRQAYLPPRLTVFGSVRDLTHGRGSIGADGKSGMGRFSSGGL